MQVDIQVLVAAKSITLGEAQHKFRSHTSCSLAGGIGLDVEIIGLVKDAIEPEVERVASRGRITGGEREVGHAEQSRVGNVVHRLLVVLIAIKSFGIETHVFPHHTKTYRRFPAVVTGGEVSETETVTKHISVLTPEVDTHISNIPFALGLRVYASSQLQLQLSLPSTSERVGKIDSTVWLIVEKAIVAEKSGYAVAFFVEQGHVKRSSLFHLGFREMCSEQAVGFSRKVTIADGVYREKWSHVHSIGNLGFLWIFPILFLIVHASVKVSVVAYQVSCHRGTKFRIHPTHQHGCLTKRLGHPLAYARGVVMEGVPYPQTHLYRCAIIGTAQQGTIGSCGKCRLYLFLSTEKMVAFSIVLILDGLQSGKQLVAFRHATGRRACCCQHAREQGKKDCRKGLCHVVSSHCLIVLTTDEESVCVFCCSKVGSTVFSFLKLKISLKWSNLRRHMKPAPNSPTLPSSQS